jgi:type I restriction enzyme R subunit
VTLKEARPKYNAQSFEDRLLLPERVQAMSRDLFECLLKTGGPEQKTIIFCARDHHADEVATALNNLYARWCQEQGRKAVENYAFKCTAASGGGDYLPDLRGSQRHHFIATTVDLLTTGVDVPSVRNVVFFKYVRSPISFYQMVGRGTRLDPVSGKLMFRVYDYTDATRLFGAEFITKAKVESEPKPDGPDKPRERTIEVEGFDVRVTDAGHYIVTSVDGKATPVTVEEYKERLAAKLVEEAASLDEFRSHWINPQERKGLLAHLPDAGRSAFLVRALEGRNDYDLYDVLAELGYGMNPLSRSERAEAFAYKNADWLEALPSPTSAALQAVARQFIREGTDGLENPRIFQTPEVVRAGGLGALKALGKPVEVLTGTKERMFAA